jgi:hypothetical protein
MGLLKGILVGVPPKPGLHRQHSFNRVRDARVSRRRGFRQRGCVVMESDDFEGGENERFSLQRQLALSGPWTEPANGAMLRI